MGSKWGYIDEIGDIAIDFQYDEAGPFGERKLALVALGGEKALIKTDGTAVLSGFYRIVVTDSMIFGTVGATHGLYDQDGHLLQSFSRTLWNFEIISDRYVRFYQVLGNANVIYDGDGEIHREYDTGTAAAPSEWLFIEEEIWFVYENGITVTLAGDHATFTVTADAYVAAADGYEIIVSRGGRYGVVGFKGNVVVDFLYAGIAVSTDGYFLVSLPDTAAFGCLDSRGRTVLPVIYSDIRFRQ